MMSASQSSEVIYTMEDLPTLKAELAKLMKSAKHRRNYIKELAKSAQPYSTFTVATSATKSAEFTAVCEELADKLGSLLAIPEIDDADPEGTSEASQIRKKYESWEKELQVVQTEATAATARMQATTAQGAVPPPHAAGQDLRSKAIPGLKPETLTDGHTMAMVLHWLNRAFGYWIGSKFARDELVVQQQTFFNLMVPELALLMKDEVTPDLIIHPPNWDKQQDKISPSCFQVVIRHWLIKYPLVANRLKFFRHRQAEGQPMSTFIAKHQEMSKGCDIEEMKPEDIFVMTLLSGCVDEDMLNELLKTNDGKPNHRSQIIQKTEEVEARRSASSAILGKSAEASALTAHQKRKQQAMAPKKQSGPSAGTPRSRLEIPPAAKGRCFVCGSNKHLKPNCQADKGKIECTFCKTKGMHATDICMHKMRANSAASLETAEPTATPELSAIGENTPEDQTASMIQGEFNPLDFTD